MPFHRVHRVTQRAPTEWLRLSYKIISFYSVYSTDPLCHSVAKRNPATISKRPWWGRLTYCSLRIASFLRISLVSAGHKYLRLKTRGRRSQNDRDCNQAQPICRLAPPKLAHSLVGRNGNGGQPGQPRAAVQSNRAHKCSSWAWTPSAGVVKK